MDLLPEFLFQITTEAPILLIKKSAAEIEEPDGSSPPRGSSKPLGPRGGVSRGGFRNISFSGSGKCLAQNPTSISRRDSGDSVKKAMPSRRFAHEASQ
jgi:hypothetical protein